MSTLVNYIEPVKFKSFEAARSEWGERWGKGRQSGSARPDPLPPPPPREEQVLRDVVLRGDQGHGATDQEPHGVCGVSFRAGGLASQGGAAHWEAGSGGSTTPDSQAPLSRLGAGLGDCPGPRLRSGGLRDSLSQGWEVGSQEPRMGLEHWARGSTRGQYLSVVPDCQSQIQQAAAQPHLPQGHPRGLVQLHAPALLERGLPARCTQLSDSR